MIVFRCNASPAVGIGHLMRCRTLASALRERGVSCVMFGPDEDWRNKADDVLFDAWLPREWTGSISDARALAGVCRRFEASAAVLDDYRVDEEYQLVLRDCGLKWMQQFNASAPPPFWGDWVVNAGPRETTASYANQALNPQTAFLLGPEYAVIRPSFRNLAARTPSGKISRILISFGGGDDHGLVTRILSALIADGPPEVQYRIMSGRRNPGNVSISAWIEGNAAGRAVLVVDPVDVCSEYQVCDLALIGGGTSTFEAAAVGMPMIIVAMANNQINQAQGWQDRGAAIVAGSLDTLQPEEVVRHVVALCADPVRIKAMSRAGRASVDGGGCDRLVDRMIGAV